MTSKAPRWRTQTPRSEAPLTFRRPAACCGPRAMGNAQAKGELAAADTAAGTQILRKHWLHHARNDTVVGRDGMYMFLEGAARDAGIEFAERELLAAIASCAKGTRLPLLPGWRSFCEEASHTRQDSLTWDDALSLAARFARKPPSLPSRRRLTPLPDPLINTLHQERSVNSYFSLLPRELMTEVPLPHITQPQPQTSYCTPKTDPHRFLGVSSRLWCIRVAVPLVYCGVKCASPGLAECDLPFAD